MQGAGGGGGGGGGCAAPLCESDGGIRPAANADVKFCLSAAAAAAADDDDVPFTNASAKSIHVGDAVIPPITPPPPLTSPTSQTAAGRPTKTQPISTPATLSLYSCPNRPNTFSNVVSNIAGLLASLSQNGKGIFGGELGAQSVFEHLCTK